jgi:hypothetical protein
MSFKAVFFTLSIMNISIHGVASISTQPKPLTLEQKLVILFEKYHMADRQWILNGIVAALPVFYAAKNAHMLLNMVVQYCQSNQIPDLSDTIDSLTIPTEQPAALPQIALAPEESPKLAQPQVTSFHFGAMSAALIFAYVISQLGTQN